MAYLSGFYRGQRRNYPSFNPVPSFRLIEDDVLSSGITLDQDTFPDASVFTVVEAGQYFVSFTFNFNILPSQQQIGVQTSGGTVRLIPVRPIGFDQTIGFSYSAIVECAAGDTISVVLRGNGGENRVDITSFLQSNPPAQPNPNTSPSAGTINIFSVE